ncbi:MAG: hypothetical protein INH43_09715, partial [Acidobacteriaceae bacterium]|nr:hypothetical protein [Acidobacteriaceae bacterium]
MNFHDKYELLAHLRDDGIKTDIVREVATGRALEAHHFVAGRTPENVALLERLDRAGAAAGIVVDRGDLNGIPYVVAEVLPDRKPFRTWLESLPVAAPPAPAAEPLSFTAMFSAAPPAPPAKPAEPLSFTAMFETAPPAVEAKPVPEPPPAKPAEPLSFTAMFPTAAPAPPASSAASAAFQRGETLPPFQAPKLPNAAPPAFQRGETLPPFQAPAGLNTAASEVTPTPPPPGEFTRMFNPNSILANRPGSAAPPAGSGNRDDDFMKLFQVPSRDKPGTSMSSAPAPAPGEFTRMFSAPTPAPATPPPAPAPAPGAFTQMFSATPAAPTSPSATPNPPPTQPTPGEFTRMFSAGTATPPPAAAKLPDPSPFPLPAGLNRLPAEGGEPWTGNALVQVKTLLRSLDTGIGTGFAAGATARVGGPSGASNPSSLTAAYAYNVTSISFAEEAFVLLTLAGIKRDRETQRTIALWGVGSETRLYRR